MATKGELEDRLSRIEAIEAREADAADDAFSLRVLREWSVPDLKRLVDTIDLSRFVAALREMRGGLVAQTFEARIAALEEAAAKREADRPTPGPGR